MSLGKQGNVHLKSTLDTSPPPERRQDQLPQLKPINKEELVTNSDFKI